MESRSHPDRSAEDQARGLIAFPLLFRKTRGSLAGPRFFAFNDTGSGV